MNDKMMTATINGEKHLARIELKILPLIKKHFAPFAGQRAILDSGGFSAKFKKMQAAFLDEARAIAKDKTFRIYIDNSRYSITVNFDINRPDPIREFGCNYYKGYIFAASLDNENNLVFDCDIQENVNGCKAIIATSPAKIRKVKKEIADLEKAIDAARSSVPYAFRDLIK